jgi:nucleoside-diphosphate-sugar epimerase
MTIHLLGSGGFIGSAIQRESRDVDLHCWSQGQSDPDHHFNLLDDSSWRALLRHQPTHLILLSWPGLPNYQASFHVTRNLPACVELVERLISAGLKRIVIAGTCYEYGLQNGALKEDQLTDPVTSYAIAKDSLRRITAHQCQEKDIQWCWARIFYPYGQGQNPNSLLPSLQRAIDNHESIFAMSSGRQLRDFIPVTDVAQWLLKLVTHPDAHGIYNIGCGQPLSLREFAEKRIKAASSAIQLGLGTYPDRKDEPAAFWADISKLNQLS